MKILTNFMNCPDVIKHPAIGRTTILRCAQHKEFLARASTVDLIVLDCQDLLIYKIAAYFRVLPMKKKPLVAVDLVLRKPMDLRHRATALIKRVLLSHVDHFIHYFKDISGYTQFFGIGAARSSYVPFKVNIEGISIAERDLAEDYVFTMGVSLRDYDTFIRAIAELPYPAAIPKFSFLKFERGTDAFSWREDNVPHNLQILEDSGSRDDLLGNLARARIVVIPIQGNSLCASGISTYLDSMYLGKCVITTAGPGASDLLTDQAILVPPHDVSALREAIRRVWEDDSLRQKTAQSGQRYAHTLGGEAEMLQRIFEQSIDAWIALARPGASR